MERDEAMPNRRDPETGLCRRGSTNRNIRGSSEARRRRRQYLVDTYRADVDAVTIPRVQVYNNDPPVEVIGEVPLGEGEPACRCYRCGDLLTVDTVTADKIIPQVDGGTYRRNNIRPACSKDNSETGGPLAAKSKRRTKKRVSVVPENLAEGPVSVG